MSKASRPHDEVVIELLREDPAFADEYLTACAEGIGEQGGRESLLMALRQVAEAQGMAAVAERAAMPSKTSSTAAVICSTRSKPPNT
jgi:DNA-binding phage protein